MTTEVELELPGLDGVEKPAEPDQEPAAPVVEPEKSEVAKPTIRNIRKVGRVFVTKNKPLQPGETARVSKSLAHWLVKSGNCEYV